jgi:Tfp pilus assembly protein PilO
MFRFTTPIILIGMALVIFFMFTSPFYKKISDLRTVVASYDEALGNSKLLENERDFLVQKYNAIQTKDLNKLEKMLPDSVENIRIVLEIEKMALSYGMMLRDVKYDVKKDEETENTRNLNTLRVDNNIYGTWDLEFSTQGNYFDLSNFIKDLEKNLRIVDIVSIQFSSESGAGLSTALPNNVYKYTFKIKTYWLKN